MKSNSSTIITLGLLIVLSFAGAALAQNGGVGNGNGNGNDKHGGSPPAAPEPGLLFMAASGLALGGGYIAWRRKLSKEKIAT